MSTPPMPVAAGFFVLRTPLLPFCDLEQRGAGLSAAAAYRAAGDLVTALQSDRERLRADMREALVQPEVREAIFVASPDLEHGIASWQGDPSGERGRRAERALFRYLTRMASRATPFGLFAGCTVGRIDERTRLTLPPRKGYLRHTRLDSDHLLRLTAAVRDDTAVRRELVLRPNSSLYRTPAQVRFVEHRQTGRGRSHHLVAVARSRHLDAALSAADRGATHGVVVAAVETAGADREAAARYVDRLVAEQVLEPELTLPVTGSDPLQQLIRQLAGCRGSEHLAEQLAGVRDRLAAMDSQGLGVLPATYLDLASSLAGGPVEVHLPRLFQVDLVKPSVETTLSSEVVKELRHGIAVLHRLSDRGGDSDLARFRADFLRRYGDRAVPLMDALDTEIGVGFGGGAEPAPLLSGLPPPPHDPAPPAPARRDAVLLARLLAAAATGDQEIVLSGEEIDVMAAPAPIPLPPSFAALATVAASSEQALDQGDFQVHLRGFGGPSGARMLGRFCYADPVLHEQVGRLLLQEEALDPEAVFAEVVHLPEGRVGNVLLRPVLRRHEIPYLGCSGAPRASQLPVDDLLVAVRDERVVLISRRLARRVVPTVTTAYDHTRRSTPVYRFLCTLRSEAVAPDLSWDWGVLRTAPFLPRVRVGRTVLALARWRIPAAELQRLDEVEGAPLFSRVQKWRAARNLPRRVVLVQDDHELVVDLEDILAIESFVHLVRSKKGVTLHELFPAPGQLCARGPEGAFTHELLVPFLVPAHAESARAVASTTCRPMSDAFPPGSQWLYVKLYCGVATADAVLAEVVAPLREAVAATGAVDCWFFVRYRDPDPHLRLRFHGDPVRLRQEILPALEARLAPLLADGRIRRVVHDTYDQEAERYGGPAAMPFVEQVFHADSDACLEVLQRLDRGDAGGHERWQLALRGCDMLLDDFALRAVDKLALVRQLTTGQDPDGADGGALARHVGAVFRARRPALETLLDRTADTRSPLAVGLCALAARSARIRPVAQQLATLESAGLVTRGAAELVPDLLHMHVNRMLRSPDHTQERVLHGLLARLYEGQLRRGAGSTSGEAATSATTPATPVG